VKGSSRAGALRRVSVDPGIGEAISFGDMIRDSTADAEPRVGADAWSIMLYTSGTTSRAKGCAAAASRRTGLGDRPCRAKPLWPRRAHARVMPLYHTMGVRSLLAMSLIGGHLHLPAAL